MKWLDSTRMPYGFITMGNNVGFFHVKNVHGGVDYTPKPGDEISFIYDDYDKGAMDVQVFPTLSNFPSTPDFPTREVESHPSDESWETESCETPTTSIINYDIEDNTKRDVGIINFINLFDPSSTLGPIWGEGLKFPHLFFNITNRHRELGLKKGDRVTYIFQPDNGDPFAEIIDVRLFDNG